MNQANYIKVIKLQRFLSTVRWNCPKCEHINVQEVAVPEVSFAAEEISDTTGEGDIELSCDNCHEDFFGYAYSSFYEVIFAMNDPVGFEVRGDPPMYEPDPDDYYPPPRDPFSNAMEALNHLRPMIDNGDDPARGDPQFGNRLVFSGAVAALEAYLGDTIRNALGGNSKILIKFSVTNDVMKKVPLTVKMDELEHDPTILKDTVEKRLRAVVDQHLREILYHNIAKVTSIYKSAFDFELIEDADDRAALFSYMQLRHDCVHRNGADQGDRKHTLFDAAFVTQAIAVIDRTVQHIERRVSAHLPF